MSEKRPLVGIMMGSDNDYDIMVESAKVLKQFDVPFEMIVSSAHRTPERTVEYVRGAHDRGLKVLIAGAGAAAHLAGVVAAETMLPVIAVPIDATSMRGLDALLAMVQMPAGIPVATMAIGAAGARNAGIFAARILATEDSALEGRLLIFKQDMAEGVIKKSDRVQEKMQEDGLV